YVLHGDADDNVPVSMARLMREELTKLHIDFRYHEQPGAGHWWSVPNSAGAACVDWPEMFDFFARRAVPRPFMLRRLEFVTPAPAVSDRCHWISIRQQVRAYRPSSVDLGLDPASRRVTGKTDNVAQLQLELPEIGGLGEWRLELDGQKLATGSSG